MLEQYFHHPRVLRRLLASPVHDQIERYVVYLNERGHTYEGVQQYVQAIEHFFDWALKENQGAITPIDKAIVCRFLTEHIPICDCSPPASRTMITLRAALNHLLHICESEEESDLPESNNDRLIDAYLTYLKNNCGLAAQTLNYRARYAREFLSYLNHAGETDVAALMPQDIMQFMVNCAGRCKRSSAQVIACSLRSFLRFLQMNGLCSMQLVRAVPRIPNWKMEGIPVTLSEAQLSSLLHAFDKTSATGLRDYAITLCMTEIGLRVSEVVNIALDDVDWRRGILNITSPKVRRSRCLPLTEHVGAAIAQYIKCGRPEVKSRQLFLRHRAPVCEPLTPKVVGGVIYRAYRRAGLPESINGTHILRHTIATRLYQNGASLKDLADLLGHQSLETTVIYTKVNLPQLATVALPWPEERS